MLFRKLILFCVIVGLGTVSFGCTKDSDNSGTIHTETSTEVQGTEIVTLDHLDPVNKTLTPTPTKDVTDFLANNGNCFLPCFWGITPGESTLEDAAQVMKKISAPAFYENEIDEGFRVENQINIPNSDLIIDNSFFGRKDIIDTISIGIFGTAFHLADYYSIESLLEREGEPSAIWLYVGISDIEYLPKETAFNILLFYEEMSLAIVYFGTALKVNDHYLVCPETPNLYSTQVPKGHTSVILYIGDGDRYSTPNSIIEPFFWTIGEISENRGEYFSPLQLDTTEDVESFYQGILAPGEDYCFDWFYSEN